MVQKTDKQTVARLASQLRVILVVVVLTLTIKECKPQTHDIQLPINLTSTATIQQVYAGGSRVISHLPHGGTRDSVDTVDVPMTTCLIAVKLHGSRPHFIASSPSCRASTTSATVRCRRTIRGSMANDWYKPSYSDRRWRRAVEVVRNDAFNSPYSAVAASFCPASYWVRPLGRGGRVAYCRLRLAGVRGGWSEWGPVPCQLGEKQRRTCTNPRPFCGKRCTGSRERVCGRTVCSSNPCQHDGTCIDQVGGYECNCKPGYTGDRCEREIDECGSSPCQNNGTCQDQDNGYVCNCKPGFIGVHCETEIYECCSSPCQHGGTCDDEVNGYECNCIPGYTGVHCETEIDECGSNPCQNSGTCQDQINGYVCSCKPGYNGHQCESCKADGQSTTCAPDEYTCENMKCIPCRLIYNAVNDCGDNSDESTIPCKAPLFSCRNNRCALIEWVLDGKDDCLDASDEAKQIGTDCTSAVHCCFCDEYVPHSECIDGVCQCVAGYYPNDIGTICVPQTAK